MQKLYWNQSSGRRHSKIFFPKGSRAEGRFEVLTIVFVFSRRYSSVTSVLVLRIFWKMLTCKGAKYYENKKQKQNKQQIPSVRNTRQAINNLYRICIFLLRLPPVTQVVNEPYFHCCWRKVVEPEKNISFTLHTNSPTKLYTRKKLQVAGLLPEYQIDNRKNTSNYRSF